MSLNSSAMGAVASLITMLLKLIDVDTAKAAIGKMLDSLEASIKSSENKVDDWALPIIAKAREILGL